MTINVSFFLYMTQLLSASKVTAGNKHELG